LIPTKGKLTQIFNSDSVEYGGSGVVMAKPIKIDKTSWNDREYSAELVLPPLGVTVYKIS
jgi:1,4-alpha-glucan branching enzyme